MRENGTSSTDSGPRVSVVVPAYNTAQFISEALDSVFHQTYKDFEVIVVNDGSPDTPELEVALKPHIDRVQYMKQPNRGVSAARNLAIEHSRGELLAFLDSDDVWLPEYLETQVKFLDENPTAVAVIADLITFGELANNIVIRMLKPGRHHMLSFEEMLQRRGGQGLQAMVVRRSKAIEAGLFDEELSVAEDVEFCLRISFPSDIVGYTRQALVKYRMRSGSLSRSLDLRQILSNEANSLHRVGQKLSLTAAQRALLNREISALEAQLSMMKAYEYLANKEFDKAVSSFVQANACYRDRRIALAVQGLKVLPRWTAFILQLYRKARKKKWS